MPTHSSRRKYYRQGSFCCLSAHGESRRKNPENGDASMIIITVVIIIAVVVVVFIIIVVVVVVVIIIVVVVVIDDQAFPGTIHQYTGVGDGGGFRNRIEHKKTAFAVVVDSVTNVGSEPWCDEHLSDKVDVRKNTDLAVVVAARCPQVNVAILNNSAKNTKKRDPLIDGARHTHPIFTANNVGAVADVLVGIAEDGAEAVECLMHDCVTQRVVTRLAYMGDEGVSWHDDDAM